MENHTGREIEGYKKEIEGPTMYDGRKGRTIGDGTWRNNPDTPGGEQRKTAGANWWRKDNVPLQEIMWG